MYLLFFKVSGAILAQSEQASKVRIISSADPEQYISKMQNEIVPAIDKLKHEGDFTGKNNKTVHFTNYIVPGATDAIVISHGFTESMKKYDEVVYYFTQMGYSVYGVDHRGHGYSQRLGIDDKQIHVENFDYYIDDLKTFIDNVVATTGHKTLFLFAHSMGGGIGARYIQTYPDDFKAAILHAPMLEVKQMTTKTHFFAAAKYAFVKFVGLCVTIFDKKGTSYIPGQGPYTLQYDIEESSTSDVGRYSYYYKKQENDPKLIVGGQSVNHGYQLIAGSKAATKDENIKKIRIPVIIYQASDDKWVGDAGMHKFDKKVTSGVKIKRFEGAKHEIYCEKDEIMADWLETTREFLNDPYGTVKK